MIGRLLLIGLLSLGSVGCGFKSDYYRLRAYRALTASDTEAALAGFRRCIELEPTDTKSHYYVGRLLLDGHFSSPQAQSHFEQAYTLLVYHDRTSTAAKSSESTGVPLPTLDAVLDGLAESLYRQKRQHELMNLLQRQIDQRGQTSDYLRQADYLQKYGDHDEALVSYHQAIRIDQGRSADPYVALAKFYDMVGDRAAALEQLRQGYRVEATHSELNALIRSHGEVPGPTLGQSRYDLQPEQPSPDQP